MTKKICFFILYLFPVVAIASPILALKSRVNINGTVVASTCSIVIDGGSSHQGLIDFGVYNKNGVNHQGVVNKPFTIKFYEKQSAVVLF